MDGEVGFESVPGQGSTFWFTAKLGLGTEDAPAKPMSNEDDQPRDQNCGTILVVEDNRINQKVLSHQLINLGYAIEEAENGVEAIAKVKSWTYDLIFMDVQMPVMDGFQATQQIRGLSEDAALVP